MAKTAVDILSISDFHNLIALKKQEYKDAIKNGKTFEEVRKILEQIKELEYKLTRKEN